MFLDFLDKEGNCQTINRITDEYTVTLSFLKIHINIFWNY